MDKEVLSQQIKAEALRLGFSACGIARADAVGESMAYLEQWLADGNQAGMVCPIVFGFTICQDIRTKSNGVLLEKVSVLFV